MSALDVVHAATWVIAVASVILALYRVATGPTLLDRVVATDVLTAGAIGVCAVMVVSWGRPDLMIVILLLVLTSFLTAVVVSRFAVGEKARERRILSKRQAARQIQEREEAARVAEQAEVEEAMAQAEQGENAERTQSRNYYPEAEGNGSTHHSGVPAEHDGSASQVKHDQVFPQQGGISGESSEIPADQTHVVLGVGNSQTRKQERS